MTLNFSREHDWGAEKKTYPVYIRAYDLQQKNKLDYFPLDLINKIKKNLDIKINEFFDGDENSEYD